MINFLSEEAQSLVADLRCAVGPDVKGIGVFIEQMVELSDLDPQQLIAASNELKQIGFIKVEERLGVPMEGVPVELSHILQFTVMEPLQAYADELYGEGWPAPKE